MEYKYTVILLAVTILECNGQLNILGEILSNARERVQSGAEGIAGAILGGLNLNFAGHLGINRHDVPQKGPEETVIVVVEEPNHSDYGPPPPPHNQGPPPHHHHGPPRPHHHHYGPPPPPPPHHNHGPPPPPPHHNQGPPMHHGPPPPPHHHHHQRPHGDPRPPGPGYNGENQEPNYQNGYQNNQGNDNLFGNNQNMRPYDKDDKNYNNNGWQPNPQDNLGYNENNNNQQMTNGPNTNPVYDNPTTEFIRTTESIKSSPSTNDDESNKITGTTTNDLPLFVPLNPDEYVYGGDKINITAPKRDTEKTKPAESDDDDFAIDIRLKNK